MIIENLLDELKLDKEKVESNELVQTWIRLLGENKNGKIDKQIFVKVCSKIVLSGIWTSLRFIPLFWTFLNLLKTLITSVWLKKSFILN